MKRFLAGILVCFWAPGALPASAQAGVFEHVASVIRSGNAGQISNYFGNNVDLTIQNTEEVYSKAQAEQILKDFFTKNPPRSFSIIHQGLSKENSKYAIGKYVTTGGNSYRTYIYIKSVRGADEIQELRFEQE